MPSASIESKSITSRRLDQRSTALMNCGFTNGEIRLWGEAPMAGHNLSAADHETVICAVLCCVLVGVAWYGARAACHGTRGLGR